MGHDAGTAAGGLKRRLSAGEAVLGTFVNLGYPAATEVVARAGFDWVLIDLEHGLGDEAGLVGQLQAVAGMACVPVVRVEGHARQRIGKALDAGAAGVMVPRVNTAAEAREAVAAMRYPPRGTRGTAKLVRAAGFGRGFDDYHARQDELLGVIQIETVESVACVEEIAAIDGVDVLFVGPSDLSMAMGIFGRFDHPDFQAALDRVIAAGRRHGKAVGILITDPKDFEAYHRRGVRFFACGSDGLFLAQGAARAVEAMQAAREALG